MKIGILTYHFANNYGAVLQAYSIQHVLQSMGHNVEIINFCSKKQKNNNSLFEKNNSFNSCIKNIIRLPHYFGRKRRINSFNEFRKKFFNLSKCYCSAEEAIAFSEKNYDIIVVGSDQVWNPKLVDFNNIYYMISNIHIPVYTYGVSLGNATEDILTKYEHFILKFKKISVREEESIKILKKINSNINAVEVIDPTLLLNRDFFKKIAIKPKNKNDYIICYFLGRKNTIKLKKAVNFIADRFNLDVYYINANYGITSYGRNVINDCSPQEFLGYLKNAKLVCTNSFHAVALSIQFKIPFYTFETDIKDTRKRNLLKKMNLLDRIIEHFEVSHIYDYDLNANIEIDKSLEYYRITSIEFLQNMLK